jgi:hypothetical protein
LGSQLWSLDFHTRDFQDRNLKTFRTWFPGCGTWISHRGLHSGLRPWAPTSIKALSACVRLSVRDATVPRFNPPAEPARTVGRTDGRTHRFSPNLSVSGQSVRSSPDNGSFAF